LIIQSNPNHRRQS